MCPREAIDFEEPYVSPYLRRRLRSLAEAQADCETRSSAAEQRIFNPTVAGSIPAGSPNTMPAPHATTE